MEQIQRLQKSDTGFCTWMHIMAFADIRTNDVYHSKTLTKPKINVNTKPFRLSMCVRGKVSVLFPFNILQINVVFGISWTVQSTAKWILALLYNAHMKIRIYLEKIVFFFSITCSTFNPILWMSSATYLPNKCIYFRIEQRLIKDLPSASIEFELKFRPIDHFMVAGLTICKHFNLNSKLIP